MANWIVSVSSEEWNSLLEKKSWNDLKSKKPVDGDLVCFYVRGTSSIKGVAQIFDNRKIKFQKIGDLNYFGIVNNLRFVKSQEESVKYLKNFGGVANLGRPIPIEDMELISSQITPQKTLEAKIDEKIFLAPSLEPGTPHDVMFKLEDSLRKFIQSQLQQTSKDWIKERVPDPKIVERWQQRMEDSKKQRKWFEEENIDLIQFADFYDLVTLIVNRGNWKKCFEKYFGNQSIIESKMYELIPIRNKLAHNRSLTEEEGMALTLYSRQILRLILKDQH